MFTRMNIEIIHEISSVMSLSDKTYKRSEPLLDFSVFLVK